MSSDDRCPYLSSKGLCKVEHIACDGANYRNCIRYRETQSAEWGP